MKEKEKLKTLKDIEGDKFTYDETDGEKHEQESHVFYKSCSLRKEAIEWIKAFEDNSVNIDTSLFEDDNKEDKKLPAKYDLVSKFAIITWIKLFFNIEEKDLKGDTNENN